MTQNLFLLNLRHTAGGLFSNGGFLVSGPFIPILTNASTPTSKGRAVCGNPARTDLCGGRATMLVPTATLSAAASADGRPGLAAPLRASLLESVKSWGPRGKAPDHASVTKLSYRDAGRLRVCISCW
jgi:hypothetical protein